MAYTQSYVPNVIELIKAGADVNLANKVGDTPLHLAVADVLETSVALLIQAGADVHKVNEDGNSPMELAVRRLAAVGRKYGAIHEPKSEGGRTTRSSESS
jgi:ankyrin repeat protein